MISDWIHVRILEYKKIIPDFNLDFHTPSDHVIAQREIIKLITLNLYIDIPFFQITIFSRIYDSIFFGISQIDVIWPWNRRFIWIILLC